MLSDSGVTSLGTYSIFMNCTLPELLYDHVRFQPEADKII